MKTQTTIIFTAALLLAIGTLCVPASAQNDPQDAWLANKSYNQFTYAQAAKAPEQTYRDDLLPTDTPAAENALPGTAEELPLATDALEERHPASPIEALYAHRAVEDLKQFGYDLFEDQPPASEKSTAPLGTVQDSFILGTGDTLRITFTGQRTGTALYKIDSDGQILIDDFPPIPAAGQSIESLRHILITQAKNLPNTQIYMSLAAVRQIGVLVIGNVSNPGLKRLSAFQTIIDALSAAGGISKDGSLRQVRLIRNGHSHPIDLYNILIRPDTAPQTDIDMNLRDGDRLIVPPLGPTLAISGAVKRPGIYEIRKTFSGGAEKLSLSDMLALSGGILAPGQNRFMKFTLTKDGEETVEEVQDRSAPQFSDGAILGVARGQEKRAGMIELTGNTRRPGLHDLSRNKSLSALLNNDQALGPDTYPLAGIIERYDPDLMSKRYLAFPVRLVLTKRYDQNLQEGDTIRLLSKTDIESLQDRTPETRAKPVSLKSPDKDTEDLPPELTAFLSEHAAYLRGAVRNPGLYPVGPGETLEGLLAASGGPALEADTSNIEITALLPGAQASAPRRKINLQETNPADIDIRAGDAVRINGKTQRAEEKTVLISGEVTSPGQYDLLPGDKVSDLLKRAGGLTPQAYPFGAIFSRESERKSEQLRFRAAAQDMQRSLAAAIERDKNPPGAAQIEMVRGLAAELGAIQAVGRITVETDPAKLEIKPELDMLLEPGDRLYIPKRPLTVRVSGEVLSPASLQFRSGKDPLDYIHEAGSFTYNADKDRTFVLYPDGSAQPLQVNTWNHKPALIPPGSTIIVPRDPKPFDFIESARDVSQILSNLAITSIFIDDLRN
ncbi:MAG: SLBB domain-containing protein [Alphaproteobacteria bacterium]|nr:SLBB domain-containing protein [Alphaproteobacteria bacterium]